MDFNAKINEVKLRVINLTSDFPYDDFEINVLTICYMAIATLDNDIVDLLDEVYSRVFILFNDGSFDKYLRPQDVSANSYFSTSTFHVDKKDMDEFININTSLFCIVKRPVSLLFEYTIHEIKHAINSILNSYKSNGKNKAYYFCGFGMEELSGIVHNVYLDESFNAFITKIYLEIIVGFKDFDVEDTGISALIEGFERDYFKMYSYDCARLLEPLFLDTEYFWLFYNAAIYKDFEPLSQALKELFRQGFTGYPLDRKASLLEYINKLLMRYENSYKDEKIQKYFRTKLQKYPIRELKIKPSIDKI